MVTENLHNESTGPGRLDRDDHKVLGNDTAASNYHFTAPTTPSGVIPPAFDPLAAGVIKISAFRQVYSSKKLVWGFWIAFTVWAFAIALSQDTTFVCKPPSFR